MKLVNPTKETLHLKIPTGRGGNVEDISVGPGEVCEVNDGYVGMAKRRGLTEAGSVDVHGEEPARPAGLIDRLFHRDEPPAGEG